MSGGLRLLAVDDELPALNDLARLLRADPHVGEVRCASDGSEALRLLSTEAFAGLFLDVRMPDVDGLALAGVLRRFATPPPVVFVSAHEEAAVSAFELQALDYLMKPVGRQRIARAVLRIVDATPRVSSAGAPGPDGADAPVAPVLGDILPLPGGRGGRTRLLHRADVLYLQSHGDYVRVVTDNGRFLVRARLGELEERWATHGFVRVHRAYVANLQRAIEVCPSLDGNARLRLQDGSELPIARRQLPALRRRLGV